ncbi:hypothetical protein F2Q70_00016970 [Brassica cretica]|uniref:Ubiquitin-like protease family profile domain-containing protein n=1 Tax=Brassica cretica TaxID=69181 RepID=A0A8S9I400_BRACR|nr:hypothetical protein F2Q70_00016970 [Brassica cretica]
MVPYALWLLAEEERKPFVDRTAFKIDCISKGVPRAKKPYGDCGVYTLKFLECLMMGIQFKPQFLKEINMGKVRENLTAAMYVETARADANMWDPNLYHTRWMRLFQLSRNSVHHFL